MKIQFNKVTWYSKLGAVVLFLLIVPVLTFYIGMKYQETMDVVRDISMVGMPKEHLVYTIQREVFTDHLDGTYVLDGQKVVFTDGISVEKIPGSAMNIETRVFGVPVSGDLNHDGLNDVVFFVFQETGGTGVFVYVVAAVQEAGGYIGTQGFYIGDRIAPQNIRINGGIIEVNYTVRKTTDPMTAQPTVGTTKYLAVEEGELVEQTFRKETFRD